MQLRSWMNQQLTWPFDRLDARGRVLNGPWYDVARIHFQLDGASLDRQDRAVLDRLATVYASLLPTIPRPARVVFIGMADPSGTRSHNLELSRRRAEAVGSLFRREVSKRAPGVVAKLDVMTDGIGEASQSPRGMSLEGESPASRRCVFVYSDFPPQWVDARLAAIRQGYRKAATRAVERTAAAIEALKRSAEAYRRAVRGTAGSPVYGPNFLDLSWEEQRLKEYEERNRQLLNALDGGTESFVTWLNSRKHDFVRFAETVVARLRAERERLSTQGGSGLDYQRMLDVMDAEIKGLEEDIADYKEGRVQSGY